MFVTAMGSLVYVTVANLVMEDVEERVPIPIWKRYVDETLMASGTGLPCLFELYQRIYPVHS